MSESTSKTTPSNGKPLDGLVTKENITAEVPGFDPKNITVCATTGSSQFHGVNSDEPLTNFDAFIAIAGSPDLALADFKQRTITLDHSTTTTEGNHVNNRQVQEFSSVQQAPFIQGADWYCYQVSNRSASVNHSSVPYQNLAATDNRIYNEPSIKARLETVLSEAGLTTAQYNLAGLTGEIVTRARTTVTIQQGNSYWDVITQLMREYTFSCYVDQQGKLSFIDSLAALPKADVTLRASANPYPNLPHHNANHVGIFNLQEHDHRQAISVSVQGFDPANPTQIIQGSSGTKGTAYNFYTADTSNAAADKTATAFHKALTWNQHYLTGTAHVIPPHMGTIYDISWRTAGEKGKTRRAKVVPIHVEYSLTTYTQQNVAYADALVRWTGLQPGRREFKITFLIVDDSNFPCPQPIQPDFRDKCVTHALTVDANGKTTGETATKGNLIALRLPMENAGDKPTIVWAYVLKPFAMNSAIPPAGTPVFVRFDAFGYAYCEQAMQQQKLGPDTIISQAEKAAKPQARVVIGTKNTVVVESDEKTHQTFNPGSVVTQASPESKQLLSDRSVETTTKDIKTNASGDVATTAGAKVTTKATKVTVQTPPKSIQLNQSTF